MQIDVGYGIVQKLYEQASCGTESKQAKDSHLRAHKNDVTPVWGNQNANMQANLCLLELLCYNIQLQTNS